MLTCDIQAMSKQEILALALFLFILLVVSIVY